MGLRAAGKCLWATHPRRVAVYVAAMWVLLTLLGLLIPGPPPAQLDDILHWLPIAMMVTARTSREYANATWGAATAAGASAGLALLGVDDAWVSAGIGAGVAALGYFAHRTAERRNRAVDLAPPRSCWLRMGDHYVPVDVSPAPDCPNCGYPHVYIGYSAFGRVEVDKRLNPTIEVDPADAPVFLATFEDVDGRTWLVPRE